MSEQEWRPIHLSYRMSQFQRQRTLLVQDANCMGLSNVYCQFGKYCHYLSWHLCKHRTLHGTCSNFSGRGLWGKIVLSEPKPALPPRVSLAFSPTMTSVLGSADTYQYHKPDALLPTVCLQNFQWETWAGIQGQNP